MGQEVALRFLMYKLKIFESAGLTEEKRSLTSVRRRTHTYIFFTVDCVLLLSWSDWPQTQLVSPVYLREPTQGGRIPLCAAQRLGLHSQLLS